jgi:hypothetical protein
MNLIIKMLFILDTIRRFSRMDKNIWKNLWVIIAITIFGSLIDLKKIFYYKKNLKYL